MTHLDTHVLAWLYERGGEALPEAAQVQLEKDRLAASPMAILELGYLNEIGRLRPSAAKVLDHLRAALGLTVSDDRFPAVVEQALSLDWTRDPFDRLIVAQAMVAGATLVTKDAQIRSNYGVCVWD